jgi:ABC-type spermidine/putrescine transport system permease subunit I
MPAAASAITRAQVHRLAAQLRLGLLAAPAVLFLSVMLFVPLANLLSLGVASGTFAPYQKALGDPLYLAVIGLTFSIALATAVICLLLGYPVALFLALSRGAIMAIGFICVLLPFWTSLLVRTYAWMVLLGRNGVINRCLLDWGLITEPLPLIFPIYAAMVRIDRNLLLAAEGLGAGICSIFWRIYLPLTLPGVFAGCALVFILSLSAFVTPALLGGGRVIMIANIIQIQVSQFLNWPFASALSAIVLAVAVLIYMLLGLLTNGQGRTIQARRAH